MRVFMTGGTGFVGTILTQKLTREGHEVTVLARKIRPDRPLPRGAVYMEGNPTREGPWQSSVPEHDVMINLAGASIFSRWTKANKTAIRDSRVLTTRHLVDALSARRGQDTLLLNTSAVGYYGFHEDEKLDEGSPPGDDYLASVSREWEEAALKAEPLGVRVVLLRFGVVLGREGGALKQMLPVFKRFLGSPLGSGAQWFSWIHAGDLTDIYLFLIKEKTIKGPVNCTAPNPVRNREFTRALGKALGKPTFMPSVPGFMIKHVMGEFGSTLLKGQRVFPTVLIDHGFQFHFPEIEKALQDLLD